MYIQGRFRGDYPCIYACICAQYVQYICVCIVYILYKKNKQAYGLEACCLSEPAEANRRLAAHVLLTRKTYLYFCVSVSLYFCVWVFLCVFQGLAGCTCAPHTKDIWRPPALHILSFSYVATYTVSTEGLHILSFSSLYCFYWRLACALAPASRITETYNIAVC